MIYTVGVWDENTASRCVRDMDLLQAPRDISDQAWRLLIAAAVADSILQVAAFIDIK